MTSTDGGRGPEPLDPDYAGLFRPDELVPAPAPAEEPTDDADEPHFEPILDPVIDPRDEEALHDEALPDEASDLPIAAAPVDPPAPPADPVVDTGRLFRSQGVQGHEDTVLALSSDHFGRLKTLTRRSGDAEPASAVFAPALPDVGPLDSAGDAAVMAAAVAPVVAGAGEASTDRRSRRSMVGSHRSRSITGGAVYIIVIGVTLVVGFLNALISGGDIGWPTGLALLVSSVYAALTVRREDDAVAMIIPPVAFFLTAITAGQVFLDSLEGSLINRAAVLFFTLADNWVWIIGSTVAALVIVLVRRRRSAP